MLSYLLEMYVIEDVTAVAKAEIVNFKQFTGMTAFG